MSVAVEQLGMVAAHARPGDLVEIRALAAADRRVEQRFVPAAEPQRAAESALALADDHDVFVGYVPRVRARGRGLDCGRASVLAIDGDTPDVAERMADFFPPSLLVGSGSVTDGVPHRQAWWLLEEPLDARWVARGNRRLAHHLAADPRSADVAHVLRVAGTRNHKHHPAKAVRVLALDPDRRYSVQSLVGGLLDPRPEPRRSAPVASAVLADADLRSIPPGVFVPALTGAVVGRDGKVTCPFHRRSDGGLERTPSLHMYATAERGWYCFGCGRGGSIIDLAAALYGIDTRGSDYHRLVARLRRELGLAANGRRTVNGAREREAT